MSSSAPRQLVDITRLRIVKVQVIENGQVIQEIDPDHRVEALRDYIQPTPGSPLALAFEEVITTTRR